MATPLAVRIAAAIGKDCPNRSSHAQNRRLVSAQIDAFRQGLADLGWVEGRNIRIEHRDAEGQAGRLLALAVELVSLNVDVIVTVDTPPTQAAKQATSTIPIVVAVSADPVGVELVKASTWAATPRACLSLLLQAVRTLEAQAALPKTAGDDDDSTERSGMMFRLRALERPQHRKLTIELQPIPALSASELAVALATAATDPPDAVIVLSPIYAAYRNEIGEFATETKVPLAFDTRGLAAEPGALLSYGADISALLRRTATFVTGCLKGAQPAIAGGAADQVRARDQPQDCESARCRRASVPPAARRRGDRVTIQSRTPCAALREEFQEMADSVAKVVLQEISKILRAAGAFFV